MNIDRIQSELIRLYGGRSQSVRGGGSRPGSAAAGGAQDAGTTRADGLALSDRASAIGRLFGTVKTAPDVRDGVVAQLRQQVQSGAYQPNDRAVAQRLLGLTGAD